MSDEHISEKDRMRKPTRAQQIFLYMGAFPALVFFQVWASSGRGTGGLFTVACAMLIYCVFVVAVARRWDKPSYFDWAICSYFFVLAICLALWPKAVGSIATEYAVTGIYICLFAAAFVPPILGFEPFTYHYAKKSTPPELWANPVFITINRIMTFAWAGIFAICTLLSLYPSFTTQALIPIALNLVIGVPFNIRFPDYYLKRLGLPSRAEMQKSRLSGTREIASTVDSSTIPRSAVTSLEPIRSNFSPESHPGELKPAVRPQPQKEGIMKVIAINSSPRSEGTSKTRMLLDPLVKGMRDAGAEVEIIHLRDKKIKNCIGCYTCWTKTPGVCVQQDDMTNELFPKWLAADLAIYATPLYHFTVNAAMKTVIERTLPIVQPFFERHESWTSHPLRQPFPKTVFLSVAGFPEASVFAQLTSYVKFLFRDRLVAEIYRPAAEMVMTLPQMADVKKDVLEATEQGGRELVQSMKISPETMERITQPVNVDFDTVAKMANAFWKTCIAEKLTPAEFQKRNLTPRPDSLDTFMIIMPMAFNPDAAGDMKAILQFNFSGEVTGSCYFKIEKGKLEAKEGHSEKPDLTVDSPFEVWMDIITGKADGQQMFMQQKYKTSGDLSLLMRLKDLFSNR